MRSNGIVLIVGVMACGSPVVSAGDAGSDAGSTGADAGPSPSYFGIFHLEREADGGVPALVANYEFVASGTFRAQSKSVCGLLSQSSFSGQWSWTGSDLSIPSDDKPGKPPYLIHLEADSSLSIRLGDGGEPARWRPGGECTSGCDGGVLVRSACANPF